MQDQKEYWDHIGKKYGCSADGSSSSPQGQKSCAAYAENRSYLGFFGAVLSGNSQIASESKARRGRAGASTAELAPSHDKTGVDCDPANPSGGILAMAKDVAKSLIPTNLFTLDQAACDEKNIPKDQLRDPTEDFGVLSVPGACVKGIWNQVINELKGIASFAKAMWRTGFFSGMSTIARDFADDPLGFVGRIIKNVERYFVEDFDDFLCYKKEIRTQRVCQFASKVVLAYFTGKALNPLYARLGQATGKALTRVKDVTYTPVKEALKTKVATPVANGVKTKVVEPVKAGASRVSDTVKQKVFKIEPKELTLADLYEDVVPKPWWKRAMSNTKTGATAVKQAAQHGANGVFKAYRAVEPHALMDRFYHEEDVADAIALDKKQREEQKARDAARLKAEEKDGANGDVGAPAPAP